ncbi:unnamed protein product [Dicrocoelium dendriticum]|nr:unnamed protein product [Dicrocoelium dendriticum]
MPAIDRVNIGMRPTAMPCEPNPLSLHHIPTMCPSLQRPVSVVTHSPSPSLSPVLPRPLSSARFDKPQLSFGGLLFTAIALRFYATYTGGRVPEAYSEMAIATYTNRPPTQCLHPLSRMHKTPTISHYILTSELPVSRRVSCYYYHSRQRYHYYS